MWPDQTEWVECWEYWFLDRSKYCISLYAIPFCIGHIEMNFIVSESSMYLNLVFFFFIFFFFLSYLTWVDHSMYNTVLPWCPGWGVQTVWNYTLPWSELTVRSFSSTAPVPQVRCSNGVSSDGNKFLGPTRNWTRDPSHQSQRP